MFTNDSYVQKEESKKALFSRKIDMIKFVRTVSGLGLVDAKNFVEWFMEYCPVGLDNWGMITILTTLAKNINDGTLVMNCDDGRWKLYRIRKLTKMELENTYHILISSDSPVLIVKKEPYVFPENPWF